MNRTTYKIVFLTGFFAFVAVASGGAMALHLLCYQHEHNSEHCPICQQLLSLNKPLADDFDTVTIDYIEPEIVIVVYSQIISQTFCLESFRPRPPPLLF
jgi:hypothetical protein